MAAFDGVLGAMGNVDTSREVAAEPGVREVFGLTKRLGCGGYGCSYLTKKGTVVKIFADDSIEGPLSEGLMTKFFIDMKGKHPAVPRIIRYGRIDMGENWSDTIAIEREPLDSVVVAAADAKLLDSSSALMTYCESSLAPHWTEERKRKREAALQSMEKMTPGGRLIAIQMLSGIDWLFEQFISPTDLGKASNWGLRPDGTLVIRDFGDTTPYPYSGKKSLDKYMWGSTGSLEEQYETLPLLYRAK